MTRFWVWWCAAWTLISAVMLAIVSVDRTGTWLIVVWVLLLLFYVLSWDRALKVYRTSKR